MSDAVIIAIVTALATALPIIVTQIAGIIISMRAREESNKKLDAIHVQTNSNLTEQKAQVKALTEKIEILVEEKGIAAGKALNPPASTPPVTP